MDGQPKPAELSKRGFIDTISMATYKPDPQVVNAALGLDSGKTQQGGECAVRAEQPVPRQPRQSG